jgi:hypothetical protein
VSLREDLGVDLVVIHTEARLICREHRTCRDKPKNNNKIQIAGPTQKSGVKERQVDSPRSTALSMMTIVPQKMLLRQGRVRRTLLSDHLS